MNIHRRTFCFYLPFPLEPAIVHFEKPEVTMERLLTLERVMGEEVRELEQLLR